MWEYIHLIARLIQTDTGNVCEPNESNSDSETNHFAGVGTLDKAIYSAFYSCFFHKLSSWESRFWAPGNCNYRVWQLQIWLYGLALFLGAHSTQVQQFDALSATSVSCISSSPPYSAAYRIGVCPKSMKALWLPPQLRYFTSGSVYCSITVNRSFILSIKITNAQSAGHC